MGKGFHNKGNRSNMAVRYKNWSNGSTAQEASDTEEITVLYSYAKQRRTRKRNGSVDET